MDAPLGNNSSYIWRSLIWSRYIVTNGLFWKVGNGDSINTRRDAWIPGISSGKITSNTMFESNMMVSSLIKNHDDWDVESLNALFLPFDVEAICRTPIMGNGCQDKSYWALDKMGSYSVKTGYWAAYSKLAHNNNTEDCGNMSKRDSLGALSGKWEFPRKLRSSYSFLLPGIQAFLESYRMVAHY